LFWAVIEGGFGLVAFLRGGFDAARFDIERATAALAAARSSPA
jgi:hypothetical protein